ncbi:aconitase X swivel domain-containing protein [Sphingobium sp.]|uniref:aconitase X swivel domain-containing protein n=1 Tax=Sphingobium sp. TaxID=1912891 RepID=UPI002C5560DB|nr:DUF126 domain-containing protein [Sphingobium sp.]HUD92478.1 DUF126 domain-containing protein [Sphingobium sp.]
MSATLLIPASPLRSVSGPALHLEEPISFWGGVSPEDGRLLEPRNAAHGESVSGRVLLIRELRGSSSASSVLLELIHRGAAPAAIILHEADAILALGILVAQEMAWHTPPMIQMPADAQRRVPKDVVISVAPDGRIAWNTAAL